MESFPLLRPVYLLGPGTLTRGPRSTPGPAIGAGRVAVLLDDLHDRGLLASTLVMVLSEFGRTPVINKNVGRGHDAAAWSVALAGTGIPGGTVHGRTDADGKAVKDGEANACDLAATIYQAVGIDPRSEYQVGLRPVPLARETARVIEGILA